MPDITMCWSNNCPRSDECYRAMAKPSKYQSWSNFEKVCIKDNEYECLIKVGSDE